jgi:hypothetical protein
MNKQDIPVFRNDPIIVLLLGFVTCGLYFIYWNIKVAEVFNKIVNRELISPPVAIFGGLCSPVNVYFYYLAGQGLDELGNMIGDNNLKNKAVLLMILGFFVPPVSAMIVQGHLNELYDKN